jgi:hypothetical protein
MFKSVLETLSDTEISVITNQLANVEIPNKSIIKQLRGKANYNMSEIKSNSEQDVLIQLLIEVGLELSERVLRQ